MYKELIEKYKVDNESISLKAPATQKEIQTLEQKMKVSLPNELKQLLSELNGDSWLCLSCEKIIEENNIVREGLSDVYEGLSELLFVAGNGCGDYYGYKIQGNACVEGEIIMWDHETNETQIVANSLVEMITRYYSDEI